MIEIVCADSNCVSVCESMSMWMLVDTQCVWAHFRKHLEGLDEGPQQDADGVALPQQLDEAGSSEQSQKAQVQKPVLLRHRY